MRIRSVRRALSIVAAPIALLWAGCSREAPPPAVPAPAAAPTPLPDADGDGVADVGDDKCLLQKEDGLPPDPDDGCKSADPDGDELLGDADRCPLEREDRLPPDPNDGCASVDPDGDNIIGAADKCPKEKETVNGFQDDDGCADAAPRVRVAGNEVKINDKIHFAFGEATIEPESQGLLREIALVINNNPQIEHMEVAGHADKMGTDAANVALSKSRAHAVLDALVKLGVNKRRLRSAGYGRYCPIDKADSDDARERNRRVEIKIMRVQGVATGVALGCEEATAASQGKRHASAQPTTAPPMSHFATGRNSPVRKTPSAQAKRSAGPAPRR